MNFISEIYWDKGERDINQDSVSLQEVRIKGEKVMFALICDGIGGLWGGEEASGFVTERMTEWFYKDALTMIRKKKRRKRIEKAGLRALYSCNEEMRQFGKEKGMKFGTTVTMMILKGRHYFLWHSGDTRAYLVTAGRKQKRMKRLTVDSRTLIRCIGSFEWKKPDVQNGYLKKKSVILLCTDGFRNRIEEGKIEEAMQPGLLHSREQIYMRLKEIAEYVKRRGEKDNITAIAIRLE